MPITSEWQIRNPHLTGTVTDPSYVGPIDLDLATVEVRNRYVDRGPFFAQEMPTPSAWHASIGTRTLSLNRNPEAGPVLDSDGIGRRIRLGTAARAENLAGVGVERPSPIVDRPPSFIESPAPSSHHRRAAETPVPLPIGSHPEGRYCDRN